MVNGMVNVDLYSAIITKVYNARRVPELIPVLGSQPAGDESHKPGGRLPLLSARLAVTVATLKRAGCYQFRCLVNTMGVNSLPKTVTRQRRGCDLNPGPSVPESSTLTNRLPSHPQAFWYFQTITVSVFCLIKLLPYTLSENYINILSTGKGQPMEPALCQLYWHTFVPYDPGQVVHTLVTKQYMYINLAPSTSSDTLRVGR